MKVMATLCSVFLWFLGGIFMLAAAHPDAVAQHKALPRVAVGAILVLAGFALVVLAWRPRGGSSPASPAGGGTGPGGQEAPGRLSLKPIVCPHCGGQVDATTATLNPEGTLTVTCGYCKGTFLIQEEPKW